MGREMQPARPKCCLQWSSGLYALCLALLVVRGTWMGIVPLMHGHARLAILLFLENFGQCVPLGAILWVHHAAIKTPTRCFRVALGVIHGAALLYTGSRLIDALAVLVTVKGSLAIVFSSQLLSTALIGAAGAALGLYAMGTMEEEDHPEKHTSQGHYFPVQQPDYAATAA